MPVSAREPFARVAPHKATQGVLPPGKDYEVFGWQVLGYAPLDGVFYMRKEDAESAASEINAAFADLAARERAAVEKVLRDAAKQIEPSERKAGPGGAPGFVQGKEEGRIVAAEYLIACADALRDWREP